MFESIKAGGILMIPIILCGIFALFVIVERIIYFNSIKKRDAELMHALDEKLRLADFEDARNLCLQANTPCAMVIKKAIDCRRYQEQDLRETVEAEMEYVVPKFEHFLTALGTIANVATLLGLLGTVTGNIKAFGVLGGGGSMGDPALLASSIGEALVTTVAGLIVSIPSIIFHNMFVHKVNRKIAEMEKNVTNVLLRISGRVLG